MRALLLALLLLPAAAPAAERRLFLGSFERVRVEGPYRVTIAAGRVPGGSVSGEAAAIDAVEVHADGATLVIRSALREAGTVRTSASPVTVALTTPVLSSVAVVGGGEVTVAGGHVPRLDLSVGGASSIALTGADTDQANATVIGNGAITLAGRAARARLTVNGAGRIAADGLAANELTVRLDGPGEVLALGRYTADVVSTGLGHIAVAGAPHCTVRNAAGGPVTCGSIPAR